jgi:tetratricopeptide (TPR) repeat protein
MVVLASRNFTVVKREKAFEQYKDVLSNWQMVQQYAKEPELSAYTAQMEKYKAICDEAHEDYRAENKRLAIDLCVKAENSIKFGKFRDAEDILKKAIDKDPENPRAWWDMVAAQTNNFTTVYTGGVLGLPEKMMNSWRRVQQYAKDPELADYKAQIEKYEALCIKNGKRARITEYFQLIKDKTKDGTYFEENATTAEFKAILKVGEIILYLFACFPYPFCRIVDFQNEFLAAQIETLITL